MPPRFVNFISFSYKISRIFWFEQLLFTKVGKLTCKGQGGLELTSKGRWRANLGWVLISDVTVIPCDQHQNLGVLMQIMPTLSVHQGIICQD